MRKIYDMGNGEFLTAEQRQQRIDKFWKEYFESIPARNEELRNLFKREEKGNE